MPIVSRRNGANLEFKEEGGNRTASGVTLQITPAGIIIGSASDEMIAQLLDNQKISLGTGSGTAGDAHIYHDGTTLNGPNPSTGFWSDCPAIAYADPSVAIVYFDDFLSLPIDDTTGNPTGWTYTGDANGDATLKTGEYGGVLNIQTGATDNNETTLQLGSGSSGTVFEITTSNAKKLWFEVRVKALQHSDEAVFVGLAEEGLGANFLTDDDGVPADKDFVGFRYKTDHSDAWDVAWRKEEQAEQEIAAVAVNADDWHTFGFKFDGVSTVSFYIDGTLNGTTMTTSAATSPSGEELAPIIAIKTGSGTTSQVDIDWIKGIMLR